MADSSSTRISALAVNRRLRRVRSPLAYLLLLLLAGCIQPEDYDLRRVSLSAKDTAGGARRLLAGGVSRLGAAIGEEKGSIVVRLTDLTRGRLVVHVAPAGDAAYGGEAAVTLTERGWRHALGLSLERSCEFSWGRPGAPTDSRWEACEIELPRSIAAATLEVSRVGKTGGELLVSEVFIEGAVRSARPPVFVVVLDAARFDLLRPFAPSRSDAPVGDALSDLARDAVLLRELRSSSSWTRPAVATLFTGLRADRHHVHNRGDKLERRFVTIAEILREQGYSTWAWSSNPNVLPLWGFDQGFDAFVDQNSERWVREKTDGAELVDRLRAALASRGPEPSFYYLHFMDPHAPYVPSEQQRERVDAIPNIASRFPRPLATLTADGDWGAFRNYVGELIDTDSHIAAFMDLLRSEHLYDDALVLLVADHGEEFLDHGGRDHGRTLYEEVLRVPGLLKLPGNRNGGGIVETPVSFEDLAPTLLEAIDVPAPAGIDGRAIDLSGRSSLPPRPHVATLRMDGRRQSTLVDPPWKLVRYEGVDTTELFDLRNDPLERRNLAGKEPQRVEEMRAALYAVLRQAQQGWHVLLCGSSEEERMDLLVRAPGGEIWPHGIEPDEISRPPGDPDAWRLRPLLAPRVLSRVTTGKVDVQTLDQAEIVVPVGSNGSARLELSSADGSALRYRLGDTGPVTSAEELDLHGTEAGVVSDVAAKIECPADGEDGTLLRVWYVAPAESLDDDDLDPKLKERLQALGYLD